MRLSWRLPIRRSTATGPKKAEQRVDFFLDCLHRRLGGQRNWFDPPVLGGVDAARSC